MSIYEKTNVARALLYWAKNNNGNECYYLEDRMYAVADGDMVILLTADSYDEAKRKAKAKQAQERPQGEWIKDIQGETICSNCGFECLYNEEGLYSLGIYCPHCGAKMKGGAE